ncbi:MAG: SDR family NAD(P)-dependent oxidoreductase [Nitrososphaerota archaeon]|nr:SDR family NAD(P)-dependent oxidoreductase [Nitrososphaerota archaeon]
MSERVVVITGASDGIGAAAARQVKSHGDRVVVVGRSASKTKAVATELDSPYYLVDFARLEDVRRFAAELKRDLPRIDVLANNAGGIMGDRTVTADGYEMTMQVNHLAPFLLTNLLLDSLIASKAAVIATSSTAHNWGGRLDFGDINLEHGYSRMGAYGKGKLMNILFTKELHRRYHAQGIAAAAFHPGVVRTNFSSEFGGSASILYTSFLKNLLASPEKGADTLVWLATTEPGKDWQSGEYYTKRKVKEPNKQAQDPKLAEDLWDLSARLVGLGQVGESAPSRG